MKHFFRNFFSIVIIASILAGGLFYFSSDAQKEISSISPIPDFLTLNKNKQVRFLDLWSPIVQQTSGSESLPDLTAKSVLMYDLTTNKTIFEKHSKQRMPMASLTKIMTAIIALENRKPDDKYIVKESALVGEDSMGVSPGEVLSFNDLIHGLMLPSGNDAAEVLASNYPSGRAGFIQAMNDKAKSLGLMDTHYDNPSGLQGDGIQFTTAYDLLVITRYALETYPIFAQVVATPSYTIVQTPLHKEFMLNNETNLLTSYPGVKGVKTGYTPEAGLCLVSYLDYEGHRIIGVLLNSENRRGEMKDLLDYSLKTYGIEPPPYTPE